MKTRLWQQSARPDGKAVRENFTLIEAQLPQIAPGEVRVANSFLSVEPAMRAMMDKVEGYPMFIELDKPLWGRAVGHVSESRAEGLKEGDLVFHYQGWREHAQGPAAGFEKLPVEAGDRPEHFLSLLGMPGATAYFALTEMANPQSGETMFVSAAAGSVGSTVLQLGKAMGLTVVGSAGGPAKCAVVRELGADHVIDYKQGELQERLRAAAPKGLDIYFDNVGGDHLDAALGNAAVHARFVECGMIDGYNLGKDAPKSCFANMMRIVASQITLRGFVVHAYEHRLNECREKMRLLFRQGKIKPLLSISDGLESTPDAFLGLFEGRNTGKTLVKL